jgi:hypothetical protein
MTEDRPDGGLYRFTPDAPADLRSGRLEIAVDAGGGRLVQYVWTYLGPDQIG